MICFVRRSNIRVLHLYVYDNSWEPLKSKILQNVMVSFYKMGDFWIFFRWMILIKDFVTSKFTISKIPIRLNGISRRNILVWNWVNIRKVHQNLNEDVINLTAKLVYQHDFLYFLFIIMRYNAFNISPDEFKGAWSWFGSYFFVFNV